MFYLNWPFGVECAFIECNGYKVSDCLQVTTSSLGLSSSSVIGTLFLGVAIILTYPIFKSVDNFFNVPSLACSQLLIPAILVFIRMEVL